MKFLDKLANGVFFGLAVGYLSTQVENSAYVIGCLAFCVGVLAVRLRQIENYLRTQAKMLDNNFQSQDYCCGIQIGCKKHGTYLADCGCERAS